jgi:type IV secretory pathway VirB4 component
MYHIEFNQTHRTFVGQAVQEVYNLVFSRKHLMQPTIVDVRAKLKEKEDAADNFSDKECIHQLYNALSEYTEGIYDMFAYPSNVDMNNRFVVFGLAHVGEDFWEPVMITMMFFLTNRMEYNKKLRRATRLVIDETQVVTNNASSARMLLDAVVTYRKFGGIVTMALQNLSRALDNPALRDMFSNCGYKCFLDQGGVDANRLAEIQELSAKEFASLAEDTPGHGVMVWGKKVILLDATMDKSNILYQHFSTNFHEGAVSESR